MFVCASVGCREEVKENLLKSLTQGFDCGHVEGHHTGKILIVMVNKERNFSLSFESVSSPV